LVVTVGFEVPQEACHPFVGEIRGGEAGDLRPLVSRDEDQQEPHRVAVAAHRRRSQPFEGDEVVDKERVHEDAEWRGGLCAHRGKLSG
jgi:hypothetical protein